MNVPRLTALRELLEATIAEPPADIVFDMSTWFDFPDQAKDVCGTAVCACGLHAIKRPQDGLRIALVEVGPGPEISRTHVLPITELLDMSPPEQRWQYNSVLQYQVGDTIYRRLEAAEMFYGVSTHVATLLFVEDAYPAIPVLPQHVIARINELLETGTIVVEEQPDGKIRDEDEDDSDSWLEAEIDTWDENA